MPQNSAQSRWYPTKDKLKDPEGILAMLKQVLDQHYTLVDQFNRYKAENPSRSQSSTTSASFPAGSGPADSVLLGLPVLPIDPLQLADGTRLTFVKAAGNFQFK